MQHNFFFSLPRKIYLCADSGAGTSMYDTGKGA